MRRKAPRSQHGKTIVSTTWSWILRREKNSALDWARCNCPNLQENKQHGQPGFVVQVPSKNIAAWQRPNQWPSEFDGLCINMHFYFTWVGRRRPLSYVELVTPKWADPWHYYRDPHIFSGSVWLDPGALMFKCRTHHPEKRRGSLDPYGLNQKIGSWLVRSCSKAGQSCQCLHWHFLGAWAFLWARRAFRMPYRKIKDRDWGRTDEGGVIFMGAVFESHVGTIFIQFGLSHTRWRSAMHTGGSLCCALQTCCLR